MTEDEGQMTENGGRRTEDELVERIRYKADDCAAVIDLTDGCDRELGQGRSLTLQLGGTASPPVPG